MSFMQEKKPLRILFATEYLPPYVSGIANRCKNWIQGYKDQGHQVTVFSCKGTDCDVVVPSLANPFYNHQRTFILPPFSLVYDLLNFMKPVEYDIAHIVAPLCLSFLPLLPLMWLRGVKIYVSYHVYLEYYRDLYFGKILFRKLFNLITDILFPLAYYLPLSFFADCVGIPSKTADSYVFDYSHRVHILKSGLDTRIFHPDAKNYQGDVLDLKSMSTEGPVLIYCGRLAVEKSIDFLIESLAELDTATLVIVGDGPIRKDLEQLSERVVGKEYVYTGESPINGRYRVIFTGMIRNEKIVASYYAQSDIFVSASGSETFGFTVAEAMACGTPSCVVRSGAFTTVYKMIDNWMFDVGNTEQFCQIIRDIYKNSSNRQLSRRIGMQFSIESSVNDLLDTYYWIVGGCQEE